MSLLRRRSNQPRWTRMGQALWSGLAFLALGLVSGCGDSSEVSFQNSTHVSTGAPTGNLQGAGDATAMDRLLDDPMLTVPYIARRRHETFSDVGLLVASYIEHAWSDGQGQFGIDFAVAETALVPAEPVFRQLKSIRRGFEFRYVGFRVRHATAFAQNWSLEPTGQGFMLNGRPTEEFQVVNQVRPDADYYVVCLDELNGFALREERYSAAGVLRERRSYVDIHFDPDLSMQTPYTLQTTTVDLDPSQDLDQQMGFEVMNPLYLPQGFRPLEVQSVVEPTTGTWNKLTYSDGVEVLIVLQQPQAQPYGRTQAPGSQVSPSQPPTPFGVRSANSRVDPWPGDEFMYGGTESVAFARGLIGLREIYLVGRVSADDAAEIMQSTVR